MECLTCKSNSGETRISPGPSIYEGNYWFVEHAYPVKIIGWLVIVLKRHAEALHELSPQEFAELAQIQAKLIPLLHEELNCEKEYVVCYAEMEGFQHIHVHVFAKPHDLPENLKGGGSFSLLKVFAQDAVPPKDIIAFCETFRNKFAILTKEKMP